MVMKECTLKQLWDRLTEIGLTDDEIQDKIRLAKERAEKADAVYIWRKDAPTVVIQCEIVEESGEDHDHWFMQG